jgi:hypothetical protein
MNGTSRTNSPVWEVLIKAALHIPQVLGRFALLENQLSSGVTIADLW